MQNEENFNLALISHEIRTPVGTALSAVELIETIIEKHDGVYNESLKNLFAVATSNIHKTLRITYNLVDTDRIVNSNYKLQIYSQNITAVLTENLKTITAFLKHRNIKVDFICSVPDVLIADFDEVAISKILINLLSNSTKHLPKQNGRIIVRLECENKKVVLSVTDNGSGINASDMPHIFKPYWHDTGFNSKDKDSIGLGLYIVKSLVELHSGQVTCVSEPYMKTTFSVCFPQNHNNLNCSVLKSSTPQIVEEKLVEFLEIEFSDWFAKNRINVGDADD